MTRIEELLLFILDRAHKLGKKDLSTFEIFKIPYLIQVYSIKYAGVPFLSDVAFIREKMGPISVNIYSATENLEKEGYIKRETIQEKGNRRAHSLKRTIPQLHFNIGEQIFLDNFLAKLLPLSQARLKKLAYSTEPMQEILKKERGVKIKRILLNFDSVVVDPDVANIYSDAL